MFKLGKGKFRIGFDNGYEVSIIYGFGSYTENHFKINLINDKQTFIVSNECEVAIIYDNTFVNPFGWDDSVKGHVSSTELLKILNEVSKL